MKMDEQALLTELNKAMRKRYAKNSGELRIEEVIDLDNPPVPQPIDTDRDSSEHNEKEIIRLLLSYGNHELEMQTETEDENGKTTTEIHKMSVVQLIQEHLSADQITFEQENYRKIYEEYSSAISKGESLSLEYFMHHQNSEISNIAIDLTTFPYTISDWLKKHGIPVQKEEDVLKTAVEHAIYSFKMRKVMKMITEIQKEIEHSSEEDLLTLVAKKKMLDAAKNAFSKELGWIVLR